MITSQTPSTTQEKSLLTSNQPSSEVNANLVTAIKAIQAQSEALSDEQNATIKLLQMQVESLTAQNEFLAAKVLAQAEEKEALKRRQEAENEARRRQELAQVEAQRQAVAKQAQVLKAQKEKAINELSDKLWEYGNRFRECEAFRDGTLSSNGYSVGTFGENFYIDDPLMQSIRTIEDRSGQQYYVFRTWKLMPNRDWVFESFNAEFLQYKKLYDVVTIKLESLLKSP